MTSTVIIRNMKWWMGRSLHGTATLLRQLDISVKRWYRMREGKILPTVTEVSLFQQITGIGADALLTIDIGALNAAGQEVFAAGKVPPRWIVQQQPAQQAAAA